MNNILVVFKGFKIYEGFGFGYFFGSSVAMISKGYYYFAFPLFLAAMWVWIASYNRQNFQTLLGIVNSIRGGR